MNKRKRRSTPCRVSPHALTVVFIGTFIILLQLAYIAFDTLCGTHENHWYTVMLYRKCLDYILAEVLITVSGAFLFDMVVRESTF